MTLRSMRLREAIFDSTKLRMNWVLQILIIPLVLIISYAKCNTKILFFFCHKKKKKEKIIITYSIDPPKELDNHLESLTTNGQSQKEDSFYSAVFGYLDIHTPVESAGFPRYI